MPRAGQEVLWDEKADTNSVLGWLIPLLSVAMYSVIFAANLTGRIQILVLLFSLVGLAVLIVAAHVAELPFGSRWGVQDRFSMASDEN